MDGKVVVSLDQAMQMAMDEALKGAPFVSPNPKVGCVILDSHGHLLAKGYHTRYGQAHAEVEALKGLSPEQLRGAHVIVTLEPCAHQGKTPSCARHLATLPLKKVTYGLLDPNPLVAGKGAEILKAAGFEVEEYSGPLKSDLEEICEEFLWNFREKKIFVALKIAQSLDGKIALKNGDSQWITGPESREKAHELRAQYDATLVGLGTVLKDNPSLNIRHPRIEKQNRVVILDRRGDCLKKTESLKLFQVHAPENIFVCVQPGLGFSSTKAQVLETHDLPDTLKQLFDRGLRSVMVEGGAQVAGEFLRSNLIQRFHIFTAPFVMGQGLSWSEGLDLVKLTERKTLRSVQSALFGADLYVTGRS
ncbi:MAG: bifunctional diaminohydroxyphosphoribosylaminopyrimidine deaminase/5-amino-6-(5-phosphoribosylamino)uracil reductase RibD [Bdellovibrionales bacterium]